MMKTAKLLLHCPDKPGILAEVTDFITVNKGNIIYLDQYVDHVENIFFMRIEWELKDFLVPQEKIEDYFATLYAQKYEMNFRLYFSDTKPRMAIFVSKMSHCLFDLLARYTAGEWNVEIPLIISNHPDLQHVAERFGIPFHLFPITKETKEEQEKKEMELLAKHKITFIVLARYMQVISEQMINAYPNRIINIHHSFLPAFVGAKPSRTCRSDASGHDFRQWPQHARSHSGPGTTPPGFQSEILINTRRRHPATYNSYNSSSYSYN